MAAFDCRYDERLAFNGVHLVVRGIADGVAYQTLTDNAWSSGWSSGPAVASEFAPEFSEYHTSPCFYVTAHDRGNYLHGANPPKPNPDNTLNWRAAWPQVTATLPASMPVFLRPGSTPTTSSSRRGSARAGRRDHRCARRACGDGRDGAPEAIQVADRFQLETEAALRDLIDAHEYQRAQPSYLVASTTPLTTIADGSCPLSSL
jgi:hypothetical protein